MVDQTRINNGKVESPNAEIDLATLLTADISELTGSISDQPITQIDGGGLEHDGNGRLQVDSSYFDGSISGLSNPLSADLDAADYNISNAGSIDSQSVNTGTAVIGGIKENDPWEQADVVSASGGESSLTTSSVGDFDRYKVEYRLAQESSGTVSLRVNGDGPTTGKYGYIDESGGKTTGANEFLLVETNGSFGNGGGMVRIVERDNISFGHLFAMKTARVVTHSQSGGWTDTGQLTDLEFLTTATFDPSTVFEVYGRDVA